MAASCSSARNPEQTSRLTSHVVLALGVATLGLALSYRASVFQALGAPPPILASHASEMPVVRAILIGIGVFLLALAEGIHPRLLRKWFGRRSGRGDFWPNLTLALLPVFWLTSVTELVLRPFADLRPKSTTLFVRDAVLGWKLRPGATAEWGGVPVRVNANGLRGPAIDHRRTSDALRILYLGDSVTFGYQIVAWSETFPAVTARYLEPRIGRRVETVNAGVGGYSPWQEWEFLRSEGMRYQPDLVVLTFVLNDVTEKNALVRFGGTGEGYHLANSYYSWYDRFTRESSIGFFVERLRRRIRFGSDLQSGAVRHETKSVEDLILNPDDDRIEELWRITLGNVDRIYARCAESDVPVVCVMTPYRFQLRHSDDLSGPQRRVEAHAAARGVPFLDLLPSLSRFESETGRGAWELFLDDSHLTAEGYELMGREVADFLGRTVLVPSGRNMAAQ